MKKLKIILAGHTAPSSGARGMGMGIARYIYALAREFVAMGHDVKLFVRAEPGFKPKESWIIPVRAPRFTWMAWPFFLARRLKKEDADLFLSDYITTGYALMKAGKRPVVVAAHDVMPFAYDLTKMKASDRARVWWYKRCFEKILEADRVIVMSEYSKSEALKRTALGEEKLRVVYNGVDHAKFYPGRKSKGGNLKIGYVGGLDGRKNVGLLIKSYAALKAKYPQLELHIGGTGKNLERFKQLNLPGAHFYGFVPERKLRAFYNSLDIFVFPSLEEGFGFMPLEAMACGVPVVAVRRASMPETIGGVGILVEPEKEDMVRAIAALAEDSKLREKLSKAGLRRTKKFTWVACASNTLKVCKEVI